MEIHKTLERTKEIFIRGGKLRLIYNLSMVIVVFAPSRNSISLPDWSEIPILLLGAILANLCFFAGPMAETYLSWMGIRKSYISPALFLAGTALSIPLIYLYGFMVVTRMN